MAATESWLDYEDYLRQRGLAQWPPEHPALKRFKAKRCATLAQVRAWVEEERHGPTQTDKDNQGRPKSESAPCSAQLVANAALSLLNLACYFLDRQLATLEKNFVEQGGFTERLYRVRSQKRTSG